MNKKTIILLSVVLGGMFSSCGDDFLTSYPSTAAVAGGPVTIDVVQQNVVSAYAIMNFDDYATSLWMPVNLFFDVATDDIYAGGSGPTDQLHMQHVADYTSSASTDTPSGWWEIFFSGLKRCNEALMSIDNVQGDVPEDLKSRLRAEVLTLRGYYMHWLWKAYGNVPFFTEMWVEEPFIAPQYTYDSLYPIILADLEAAIANPDLPMYDGTGRITKSMAMMTKARVVMYYKDESKYAEVLADMKTIINDGHFKLVTEARGDNFTGYVSQISTEKTPSTTNPIEWIFLRDGEFCSESIFEVNCVPEGKSWGNAWAGYGNYTPRFVGCRDASLPAPYVSGWGCCPINKKTFDAVFNETGDFRKDATAIYFPTKEVYQCKDGLFLKKYIARWGYNVGTQGERDLNYENNRRIYRIAEAYLNAAELEVMAGGGEGAAQPYLDAIRDRAFGDATHRITATLANIRLERHREFYGEGMRFWDLMRWGGDENGRSLTQVLTVTDLDVPISRVWDDSRKFLPIPKTEIDKTTGSAFELVQNPGY